MNDYLNAENYTPWDSFLSQIKTVEINYNGIDYIPDDYPINK